MNSHRLLLYQSADPCRDDCCVCAVRILSWTEDVKISQANRSQRIATSKHMGIKFVHIFRGAIRGEKVSKLMLSLRQFQAIAIDSTAGCIDEGADFAITGGN